MIDDLAMQAISAAYLVVNSLRLVAYLPQIAAVARDRAGATAISLPTWVFWAFSNAVTAVYCALVARDPVLAGMMWGNCAGATAIAAMTLVKRRATRVARAA